MRLCRRLDQGLVIPPQRRADDEIALKYLRAVHERVNREQPPSEWPISSSVAAPAANE